MNDPCRAAKNQIIPCEGEFVPSEGLCLRHAVLFDYWIADRGGWRVYASRWPRRWKRRQFHRWLDRLTLAAVERIMNS